VCPGRPSTRAPTRASGFPTPLTSRWVGGGCAWPLLAGALPSQDDPGDNDTSAC
jgi:hypothetical protein